MPIFIKTAWVVLFTAGLFPAAAQRGERPQDVFDQAVADFEKGRIADSAAGFDTLVKLIPDVTPQLWQRGIVLYYAGRFKDCRAQFESHRTVNPNDVENAVWHYLCVARDESPERARNALLPVGPDPRVPMREIYELFQGKRKPDEILTAAGAQTQAQFYALLYLGLYSEAANDKVAALQYITKAADPRFAAAGGYMHTVARVHLEVLRGKK